MKNIYRIEEIHIPAHKGIADQGADGRELGRRIIHVFGEVRENVLRVLTEEVKPEHVS